MVSATPRPLYPGKELWYRLYSRLGGPQTWSGWVWETENLFLPPGFEPRTVQHVTSRHTFYFVVLAKNNCGRRNIGVRNDAT